MLKIYHSHPMELGDGTGTLMGSGARAFDVKAKLPEFEHWIPEENQARDHRNQQKIDLDALEICDIILVDLYHYKLDVNGHLMMGKGTNQEIGFIKFKNRMFAKKVPIIQIIRQTKKFHCFDVGEGVINVNSIQEAIDYIKENLSE